MERKVIVPLPKESYVAGNVPDFLICDWLASQMVVCLDGPGFLHGKLIEDSTVLSRTIVDYVMQLD